jgi:signal-transduction protein with cAMP-binding, CBS, and nucleotidyltransferase domain
MYSNMKIGVKVGDIMTRNFTSVSPKTSLLDCAKYMVKKRVGSLILQDDNRLKGIITEGDIIWALTKKSRKDLSKVNASEIAPKKLVTIKPSADLYEALQKMKRTKYRWLPVTINKNIIGFLTIKDILRIEPSLFDTASEIMQIKEESEKLKRRKAGEAFSEGLCEECGNFNLLYKIDSRMICEDCRDEM